MHGISSRSFTRRVRTSMGGLFFHGEGTSGIAKLLRDDLLARARPEEVLGRKLNVVRGRNQGPFSGHENETGVKTGKKRLPCAGRSWLASRILRGKVRWLGGCNKRW